MIKNSKYENMTFHSYHIHIYVIIITFYEHLSIGSWIHNLGFQNHFNKNLKYFQILQYAVFNENSDLMNFPKIY